MCYGDLDPKLLTREVEARLRGLPKQQTTGQKQPETTGLRGLTAAWAKRIGTGWFKGKEATHG